MSLKENVTIMILITSKLFINKTDDKHAFTDIAVYVNLI